MTGKCPICEENKLYGNHLNSYDEPPEYLNECSNCGFREFYFYYDGYVTKMNPPMFHNSLENSKVFSVFSSSRKDFAAREGFKRKLDKVLKKEGLSVQDLIDNIKNSKETKRKEKEKKELEKNKANERWKYGELIEEEKIKLNDFLKKTLEKLKEFEKYDVVSNVKEKFEDGYLVEVNYEYNEKAAMIFVQLKKDSQSKYAIDNKLPMFAPLNCWNCNAPIFGVQDSQISMFGKTIRIVKENISLEKASTQLVTGCPSCNRSFVD